MKKVDSQGRLILPSDWRVDNLKGKQKEVFVIKRKHYLKIIPKRRVDLTKFFDAADLDIDAIGEWTDFERMHSENASR